MRGNAINSTGKKSDFFRSAAVAYMTINMTVETIQSEKSEVIVTTKSSKYVTHGDHDQNSK